MSYDRRPDRRPGGGRPPGGRPQGRPDRPPRDREGFGGPPRDRGGYGQRPPARGGYDRPPQRPTEQPPYMPRGRDEGGMSIRLDPRRLAALKLLAAEVGVRPGELVTKWVEERLDAARSGEQPVAAAARPAELAALNARIEELARRVDALAAGSAEVRSAVPAAKDAAAVSTEPAAPAKRRGRPPKSVTKPAAAAKTPRVPLHDEIAAVISERGPMTAGELAAAILERGRYTAPRSAKPLDSTTVNARVSNPIYRSRFTRDSGRIGLANTG